MKHKRTQIVENLADKDVLIWGARMTGLGALRLLRQLGVRVIGFIDSDDAFKGKVVNGLPVLHPSELKEFVVGKTSLALLIAVSLKEQEILSILAEMGVDKLPVLSFQDPDMPYYTVDILSSCNLRCASCPHSIEDHAVPKGSMSLDTFKQVFDKILNDSPDITHLSLYSWGEPLLHPHVDEIVRYVHEHGVAVALSSNLSIKFDQRIERLLEQSPDYLKVSLSGYYPDAYNNTHQGGDINLVKSNLYRIRYLLDKLNSETFVDINYHLYRDNSGENLNKFKALADELGFVLSQSHALVMPLERVLSFKNDKADFQTLELQKNLLVTIDEGIAASTKTRLDQDTCPFRENQININADLTVPVCCTVFERGVNVVAENFLETTLQQISTAKSKVTTCTKCMELGLPEYNMGFNQMGWKEYAKQKTLVDIGNQSATRPKQTFLISRE